MTSSPLLELRNITKSFGGETVVDNVTMTVGSNMFHALLGPSGCGKTTIMRMIAGFETPDAGQILLNGEDIADIPAHNRAVNMMFQSYALFPHMTVAANIGFGLEMAGLSRKAITAKVEQLLIMMRLEGLGSRTPEQLSGGQKQRVALARALAREPRLLLLDEPLGALDRRLRDGMQLELKTLQQQLGLAFLVVTHDQDEALSLADQLSVMAKGRIVQTGAPRDVYEHPETLEIARFIGEFNLLKHEESGGYVGWRPEKAVVNGSGLRIEGKIRAFSYRGGHTIVTLAAEQGSFVLPLTSAEAAQLSLSPGSDIAFHVPHEALIRVAP